MKLKDEFNVVAFLENAQNCIGDVFFHTTEGDILNLKSVLSQYVLVSLICNPGLLQNAKIICTQEEDYANLSDYLLPEEE